MQYWAVQMHGNALGVDGDVDVNNRPGLLSGLKGGDQPTSAAYSCPISNMNVHSNDVVI